ncbi:GntR family transcriptional regulator [Lysinibacillus alkalisoli]|uniref:GntR family transcriptional regulator n=1 Tax=Lysinibacillus alkalisoli TaxID=1911548 RepID=A0A917LGG3_9BACI|nr:GntR family transcriptional regulator [Lysinibacillus alkalisoli]GGG22215.1 GntR family transcriptional regulator [Lysinibacillus alkalisoli]
MNIILRNTSNQPIYEQITTQIKQAILADTLQQGDALPSIRMLAKDLKISVMTTKRAYADLERDGFIETVAGKGSFVSARNKDFIREEHYRQVEQHLQQAIELAKLANFTQDEFFDLVTTLYEEEQQ